MIWQKTIAVIPFDEVLNEISFFILEDSEIETSIDDPGTKIPEPEINYIVEDEKMDEVFKVQNRIPRWFKNPHQINSRILIAYMELLENDKSVSYHKLESSCRSIETFQNNYVQMKSFGERNHAKVLKNPEDGLLSGRLSGDLLRWKMINT
jgi:hypothetical protein